MLVETFAPILLIIIGGAGAVAPELVLRFFFLGLLSEDALTKGGVTFFRTLGVLCMAVGLFLLFV